MANEILISDIQATTLVPITSRYSDGVVIYYGPDHKITFKTYQKKGIKTSTSDRYMQITPAQQYRPDKVSQLAYGMVDLWWVIMEANNIKDIFDFKAGITVRVPATVFQA